MKPIIHLHGGYQGSFAAVAVALVNETIAIGAAIHMGSVTATAAADILSLCTGLLQSPYTYSVVVARRCKHVWIPRVPAYTVDRARVARQSLDNISRSSVPYIDLAEKMA
jgi:hypothetical protein